MRSRQPQRRRTGVRRRRRSSVRCGSSSSCDERSCRSRLARVRAASRRFRTGACHEVHGVEPELERGRGLLEDRPLHRVDVEAARVARVGRPGLGAVELALPVALGAVGVMAVRRVALPPEPVEARRVVGLLAQELDQRVVRVGRGSAERVVAVVRGHGDISVTDVTERTFARS